MIEAWACIARLNAWLVAIIDKNAIILPKLVDPIVYLIIGVGIAYLVIGALLSFYSLKAFQLLRNSKLLGLALGFLLLGIAVLMESALSLIYGIDRIVYLYSRVVFVHAPLIAVLYNVIVLAAYIAFAYSVTNISMPASPLILIGLYSNPLMQLLTPAIQLYVALMLWIQYYKGNSLVSSNAIAFTLLLVDNFVLQALSGKLHPFLSLLIFSAIRVLGLAFLVNGATKVNYDEG